MAHPENPRCYTPLPSTLNPVDPRTRHRSSKRQRTNVLQIRTSGAGSVELVGSASAGIGLTRAFLKIKLILSTEHKHAQIDGEVGGKVPPTHTTIHTTIEMHT